MRAQKYCVISEAPTSGARSFAPSVARSAVGAAVYYIMYMCVYTYIYIYIYVYNHTTTTTTTTTSTNSSTSTTTTTNDNNNNTYIYIYIYMYTHTNTYNTNSQPVPPRGRGNGGRKLSLMITQRITENYAWSILQMITYLCLHSYFTTIGQSCTI